MLIDKYLNMTDDELIRAMKEISHKYENCEVYDLLYAATIRIAVLSAMLNADKSNEA